MRTDDDAASITLANRQFLYRYLWRAFAAEPDETLLDVACGEHAQQACALAGEEAAHLQSDIAPAAMALREAGGLEALRTAYTRLFVGPAALPAPPWESVYTSGENLIFQKSTLDVRAAFRAAGYQAAGYLREADDHLATELDFMAVLAESASQAFERGDVVDTRALLKTQSEFLDQHLGVWTGAFADRLAQHASTPAERLYVRFAELCAVTCQADAAEVRALLAA